MNDIHDNLPAIKLEFFTIFDWLVFTLLCIAFLTVFWKLFKFLEDKFFVEAENIQVEKFVFSDEIRKLKRLQKNNDWKTFSLDATIVLKKIFEKKYFSQCDLNPFAATSKEFLKNISRKKDSKNFIDKSKIKKIRKFFDLLDPVKFANAEGKNGIADEIILILKELKKELKYEI